MNDAIEALSIGFAVAMIFSVPFAFFAYIRYLRYKETIALAERGLIRPSESNKDGRNMLRWGIVITFVGLALVLVAMVAGLAVSADILPPLLLLGCLPMFFGLALLVIYAVTRREKGNNDMDRDAFPDDPIPPHKQS